MIKNVLLAVVGISLGLGGLVPALAGSLHERTQTTEGDESPYTEVAILRANPPEPDQFGNNLSIEGDLLLVGTYGENGNRGDTAHLFRRAPGKVDPWQEVWTFNPDSAGEFGGSVDLDGRRSVIWGWETAREEGAVWVFQREDGDSLEWREVTILREQDPVGDTGGLGEAAISGDTIVAGATKDDELGQNSGAAYVFERNDDPVHPWQWVKLLAPDGQGDGGFGGSVDIEGNTIAVGAWLDDEMGNDAGAVWVFERRPDGTWEDVVKLMGSEIGSGDGFGSDLALDGDVIAVVSDPNGPEDVVYLFERDAGGPNMWGEVAKLVPSEVSIGFRADVAIEDGVVALGGEGGGEGGAAFIFLQGADGVWTEIAKLTASDGEFGDDFGESIGISGRIVAVGADRAGTEVADSGGGLCTSSPSPTASWKSLLPMRPSSRQATHSPSTSTSSTTVWRRPPFPSPSGSKTNPARLSPVASPNR